MENEFSRNNQPLPLTPDNAKKRWMTRRRSEIIFVIFMLLLPLIQFAVFWLVPNFDSIVMGFRNASGSFTLENFRKFFTDLTQNDELGRQNELVYSIVNSLIYFAVNIFVCTPIVVFFSYILYRKVPLNGVFKVVFYLPSIIGGTVMATLYKKLLDSKGPLFQLMNSWGWISKEVAQRGLFAHGNTAFLMVVLYSIWTCVGINMIMFHGAMKRIPNEIFESADIDGVGFFKQFTDIVVPLIWPTVSTLVVFSLAGIFVTYGPVMILAPDKKEASMIGWFILSRVNQGSNLNYPAAVGLIFTAVGLPFVLLVRYLLNKIGDSVEY
ncbi:MAG: sugar ABC transporter permease [Bacilli bacterium]|nr:sugar ABC transporter permease [Bacilli bacterium]